MYGISIEMIIFKALKVQEILTETRDFVKAGPTRLANTGVSLPYRGRHSPTM